MEPMHEQSSESAIDSGSTKVDTMQRLAAVPVTDDVVAYTLACVLALAPRTSTAMVTTVERQVRDIFGGYEVWVTRAAAQLRADRDQKIRRDYLAGERLELLQRRYSLSKRRLLQIVKS